MEDDFEFARLVYQLIVVERVKELSELAPAMDMKYATLHARLNRRIHFRPGEIRRLITLIPDARLMMHFLEETPFVIAERAAKDTDSEDVMGLAMRSLFGVVDVLRGVRDALDDGKIDHREREEVLGEIEKAEIVLASLKASVSRAGIFRDEAEQG